MTAAFTVRGHRPVDLVVAGLAAVVVEVGLRVTTLPPLARRLGVPLALDGGKPSERVDLPDESLARAGAARAVMRRWPLGDSCLRRSLVMGYMLRQHDPLLGLGVQKVDDRVRAHAWLVIAGRALDPAVSQFAPLRPMGPR